MPKPANDLRDFVVTNLGAPQGPVVAGESAFSGEVVPPSGEGTASPVEHKAVFFLEIGGPPKQITMGASAANDEHPPNVQVFCRGDRQEPDDTREFARAIFDLVHKQLGTVAKDGGGFYSAVLVFDAQPIQAGQDETLHPIFTFNVEMWHTGP